MGNKKNFFAPLALGLGATRRAAAALAQVTRRGTAALALILLTATTALATIRTVTYTIGYSSGNGYYLTGDDGTQSAYWSQVTEHHTTLNLTLGSDVTISIASAYGGYLIVGDLNESSAVIAGFDRGFDNDIDVTVTSQSHYICHFKMIGLGYNSVPVQTSMESFDNEQSSTLNWRTNNQGFPTNGGAGKFIVSYSDSPAYNISYVLNGGTNAAGNPSTYDKGTGVASLANPTRTGYTFGGWYDNPSFSGSPVTSISTTAKGDVTLYAKWTPDPDHFSVNGAGTEYTIHTATGWSVFCDCLDDNDTYNRFSGKTVRLADDITVTRMAGSDHHDFCGTFDGQGHTLTVNISSDSRPYTAPFAYVSETTPTGGSEVSHPAIRNLNVTGTVNATKEYASGLVGAFWGTLTIENCTSSVTVNTSNKYAAGFISAAQGNATIRNCLSSATINSTVSGDGTHAGFIGVAGSVGLNIEGCAFTGSLLGTSTTSCAGFVGFGGTVTITNSLYAPASVTVGATESATFARGNTPATTNSYYSAALGTAQGKAVRTVTAGTDVTLGGIALSGSQTAYNVSHITAYANGGLQCGDDLYYGSGDQLSLALTNSGPRPQPGYHYAYTVSGGTLSGSTLTMPDADVTVSTSIVAIDWATVNQGNSTDPYMIYNKDQLLLLAHRVNGTGGETANSYWGEYFKLGADITFDPDDLTLDDGQSNYEAIGGYNDRRFCGDFDGDGYTVSGIRIRKTGSGTADINQGLFGLTGSDAEIRNVHLSDARITGFVNVGGIVGTNNDGTVSGCYVTDSYITASYDYVTGTICGDNNGTLTNNYYHGCTVNGTENATNVGCNGDDIAENDGAVPFPALADATENTDVITKYNGQTIPVVLQDRTLYKDGKWNTLCLPFSLTAEQIAAHADFAGATLMTLDATQKNGFDTEDGTLYLGFKTATEIEAGVPYLVKWTSGDDISNPVFLGVTISNTEAQAVQSQTAGLETVQMVGTFSPVSVKADDKSILFLSDANTLYYSSIDRQLCSCRAHFSVPYINGNAGAEARAFVLGFDDEEATAISLTPGASTEGEGSDCWYTIDGRKLSGKPSQRGMYINKGKKILVK